MNLTPMPDLTLKEQQAIEVFIERLYDKFPGEILQIALFGSKARGDSGRWSDLDILIIIEEESWPLRENISTLAAQVSLEYDVLIGPRVIGTARWERMKQDGFSLYRNIVAEGVFLTHSPTIS